MGRVKQLLAVAVPLMMMACAAPDDTAEEAAPAAQEPPTLSPGEQSVSQEGIESLTATLTDSVVTLSADSVVAGAVTILVRNSGTSPQALRVEGASDNWETEPVAPGTDVSMSLNLPLGEYTVSRVGATTMPQRLRVY